MSEEARPQSWWQTLPGILTALAAGLTATSGLIAALYQAGIVGKKEPSSSGSPVASVEQVPARTASITPVSSAQANAAGERAIDMPDGRSVSMFDGTGLKYQYTVVAAKREPTSPQKQLLRLRVRVWTNAAGGALLWSDSFRLKVGELRLKPVNDLSELAAQDETKEGDVEFEVDASLQEAVLSINVGGVNFEGNTKELRLKLV